VNAVFWILFSFFAIRRLQYGLLFRVPAAKRTRNAALPTGGVSLHLKELRKTKWPEYVVRLVFGGAISVVAAILAERALALPSADCF
jgi:hypothetical protein